MLWSVEGFLELQMVKVVGLPQESEMIDPYHIGMQ